MCAHRLVWPWDCFGVSVLLARPPGAGAATFASEVLYFAQYFDCVSAVVVEEYIREVFSGSWDLFVQSGGM